MTSAGMIHHIAGALSCPVCASPDVRQAWHYVSIVACPRCGWAHPGDSIEQINPSLIDLRRRAALAEVGHPEWDLVDRWVHLRDHGWDGDDHPDRATVRRWLRDIVARQAPAAPAEGWAADVVGHLQAVGVEDEVRVLLSATLPPSPGSQDPGHFVIGGVRETGVGEMLDICQQGWSYRGLHRDARHALQMHVTWLLKTAEADAIQGVRDRWVVYHQRMASTRRPPSTPQ